MTPDEWKLQRAQEALQRCDVRQAATPVPLTLDALLTRFDISRELAEHCLQPYCECSPWGDIEGQWWMCQHARDLGLEAYL